MFITFIPKLVYWHFCSLSHVVYCASKMTNMIDHHPYKLFTFFFLNLQCTIIVAVVSSIVTSTCVCHMQLSATHIHLIALLSTILVECSALCGSMSKCKQSLCVYEQTGSAIFSRGRYMHIVTMGIVTTIGWSYTTIIM